MSIHQRFVAATDSLELRARVTLLRRLLAEAGYRIFDADPSRSRTDLDMIVFKPMPSNGPVWIYPSKTGRLIIRPWSGSYQARRLRLAVPENHRRRLRMLISREMAKTPNWRDWLSPASRLEARLLGLPA